MATEQKRMTTPFSDKDVLDLRIGDIVLLSGTVYTARDAAHKKLVELLEKGEKLPIDPTGQIIYYVGPSPAKPGRPIGSAGPTTSGRMNPYAPKLIAAGLKGMIGKGEMGPEVVQAMKKHKAVYFTATGGAAALIAQRITASEVVAYEDLGAEAIRKLTVKDFPINVAQDCYGGNLYIEGVKKYKIKD